MCNSDGYGKDYRDDYLEEVSRADELEEDLESLITALICGTRVDYEINSCGPDFEVCPYCGEKVAESDKSHEETLREMIKHRDFCPYDLAIKIAERRHYEYE